MLAYERVKEEERGRGRGIGKKGEANTLKAENPHLLVLLQLQELFPKADH